MIPVNAVYMSGISQSIRCIIALRSGWFSANTLTLSSGLAHPVLKHGSDRSPDQQSSESPVSFGK